MNKCHDCLANYSDDVQHVCPPWLKELVAGYRRKKKEEKIKKRSNREK